MYYCVFNTHFVGGRPLVLSLTSGLTRMLVVILFNDNPSLDKNIQHSDCIECKMINKVLPYETDFYLFLRFLAIPHSDQREAFQRSSAAEMRPGSGTTSTVPTRR